MINWFKKITAKGIEESEFNAEGEFKFLLKIQDLIIGYLSFNNGDWEFQYSEEFKNQKNILELPDSQISIKYINPRYFGPSLKSEYPASNNL